MALSQAEVKKLLQQCFPPGSDELYGWNETGANYHKIFTAMASGWKTYGTDLIDTLRLEVNPYTCTGMIPEWEKALGLSETPIAKFGTTAQRRNAVLGWLRQSGTFTLEDIRAIAQPFLLYANPANIQILETDRVTLTAAHTYAVTTGIPVWVPNSTQTDTVEILDDPVVSHAGVHLILTVTATIDQLAIKLTSPGGTIKIWDLGFLGTGVVAATQYTLRTHAFDGKAIRGDWILSITSGAGAFVLDSWGLFVEGLGVNYQPGDPPTRNGEGLGSAMFEFAVVVDTTLAGTGYDVEGMHRALQRMKPAHVKASVVVMNTVVGGGLIAIPDETTTLPDRSIPG